MDLRGTGREHDDVEFVSLDVYVRVQTPGDIPPVADLMADLKGVVPDGISVIVRTSLGEQINAGSTGSG